VAWNFQCRGPFPKVLLLASWPTRIRRHSMGRMRSLKRRKSGKAGLMPAAFYPFCGDRSPIVQEQLLEPKNRKETTG